MVNTHNAKRCHDCAFIRQCLKKSMPLEVDTCLCVLRRTPRKEKTPEDASQPLPVDGLGPSCGEKEQERKLLELLLC